MNKTNELAQPQLPDIINEAFKTLIPPKGERNGNTTHIKENR